jgi:hypothetical protein
MITVLVHVANSESVKLDMDELPGAGDALIIGKNPRERNDKEATWIEEGVTTIMFPVWRVTLIEVLPREEEEEEFPLPFRND